MPKINVNDVNINYEVYGDGDPLIFIPGIVSNIYEYKKILTPLSKHFKLIAVDNRGTGKSDKPKLPKYTIEMMADDVIGVMDNLKLEKVHVIGISMGGNVAISLYCRNPKRINSLILISTYAKRPETSKVEQSLKQVLKVPIFRGVGKHHQPLHIAKLQLAAISNFDYTDRLKNIKAPTLIIHGNRDKLVPYKYAENLHGGIKDSRLIKITGGHLFFFIKTTQFVNAISEFVHGLKQ